MRGIAVTVVAGVVLGVTSWWHQRAGGMGTVGWLLPAACLAVLLVFVVIHLISGEGW